MSLVANTPAQLHTSVCGIYRWPDRFMQVKPGPYYSIIVKYEVVKLMNMIEGSKWDHAVAVVDDFGNLVGVPA